MNLPNGTLLQGGKYRIQRFISSGGFGCTYEAINTTNQQRVAIKELFVKDVSDRDEHTLTISAYSTNKSVLLNKIKKKFLEEANALKAMSHPNIVRVHESFEENGTAYYVMDYIDGQSLHDIIKQSGALSESRSLKYINQVADALAYVHARNRLHLDIKPGNIMIDSHDKVVLIDFGVSKQYDEANGENTSTLIGKSPGYSPVEQLGNNVQQFSPATDIYALGATLYKCVTGNTPPHATTVLSDGLPELPHSISNSIRETIKKSMSPIKGNRPQSIKAFLDSLRSPVHKKTRPSGGNQSSSSNAGIWIGVLIIAAVIGILFIANNNSNSDSYSQNSGVQLPESQEEVQPQNEFECNNSAEFQYLIERFNRSVEENGHCKRSTVTSIDGFSNIHDSNPKLYSVSELYNKDFYMGRYPYDWIVNIEGTRDYVNAIEFEVETLWEDDSEFTNYFKKIGCRFVRNVDSRYISKVYQYKECYIYLFEESVGSGGYSFAFYLLPNKDCLDDAIRHVSYLH